MDLMPAPRSITYKQSSRNKTSPARILPAPQTCHKSLRPELTHPPPPEGKPARGGRGGSRGERDRSSAGLFTDSSHSHESEIQATGRVPANRARGGPFSGVPRTRGCGEASDGNSVAKGTGPAGNNCLPGPRTSASRVRCWAREPGVRGGGRGAQGGNARGAPRGLGGQGEPRPPISGGTAHKRVVARRGKTSLEGGGSGPGGQFRGCGEERTASPSCRDLAPGREKPSALGWETSPPILRGNLTGQSGRPSRNEARTGSGVGGCPAGAVTSTGAGGAQQPASRLGSSC